MAQSLKQMFDVGDGYEVMLYARRYMCHWLHRSPRIMLHWIERKIVPPPIFKVQFHATWFCADEIYIYCRAAAANGIKRGLELSGSHFSVTVWAEVLDLQERIRTIGPHILKKEVDQDELIRTIAMFDWRRKRIIEKAGRTIND